MKYSDYNMKQHGFVGHMAEPDTAVCDKAVIVIMGGEKSILPGIKIAETFADNGITALSVSLFGADGLPNSPDRVPVEMFGKAINFLRNEKHIDDISIYGMSMGTVFAVLAAEIYGGIKNLILCSPTHIAFEGTTSDKKQMTNHSIATYKGKDIPFAKTDFTFDKMSKYPRTAESNHKVTNMWIAFKKAYSDKEQESKAYLHHEKTGARILLIAGTGDEAWQSDYSAKYIMEKLQNCGYQNDYKMLIYENASHLIGVMPNRQRNKWLFRAIPLIGLFYKSFSSHREECMKALQSSEKEVINWILQ